MKRASRAALVAVVAVLLGAACSDERVAPHPTPTPPAVVPSASPDPDEGLALVGPGCAELRDVLPATADDVAEPVMAAAANLPQLRTFPRGRRRRAGARARTLDASTDLTVYAPTAPRSSGCTRSWATRRTPRCSRTRSGWPRCSPTTWPPPAAAPRSSSRRGGARRWCSAPSLSAAPPTRRRSPAARAAREPGLRHPHGERDTLRDRRGAGAGPVKGCAAASGRPRTTTGASGRTARGRPDHVHDRDLFVRSQAATVVPAQPSPSGYPAGGGPRHSRVGEVGIFEETVSVTLPPQAGPDRWPLRGHGRSRRPAWPGSPCICGCSAARGPGRRDRLQRRAGRGHRGQPREAAQGPLLHRVLRHPGRRL